MKKAFLFLICAIVTQTTFAQQVKLQISNKETKEPIEFATVLLPDYKKSFTANENGLFVVDAKKYNFPLNVVIETFGFEKKSVALQNLKDLQSVFLEPSSELLQEILIPPKNAKIIERTYGRTSEGSGMFSGEDSSSNYNTSYEFGMIMNIKEKFIKVKKIHWHLEGFTFKRGFFSIYFYEVKNGKPYKRIPHQNINFILSNKTRGWNVINIEDMDLYISGYKKIAVIIKQQKIEFQEEKKEGSFFQNIGLTTGSTFFTRTSSDGEWLAVPASIPLYITVDSYE
ncbi:hypothetical protein H1R17_02860 [Flavobacterium sp. xlx-214]|uniref:carboxypeptidase-like regulatory domain-containing protein n=1 Tax=unclassified Flavobacterium TaxID=196869 RepID=UPI0013D6B7D3|nr:MULTISPECIES: carboxypeptidase-like regulatory domain-containing protein [unclassified Flavobacterium]MBA5793345.1 hypothetical protein [Flavobacterium sp. xlx-221]QMI84092.1 hypothetical protein H1R17_02860 [Flavobacterium sp. xlx-214]